MVKDIAFLIGSARIWSIKFRAGPNHKPIFHADGALSGFTWSLGDVENVEAPDPKRYNQWVNTSQFQTSPDRATGTIMVYETPKRSSLFRYVELRCPFDVQVHLGLCGDPSDFDGGWEEIKVLENVLPTSYSNSDFGAQDGGDQGVITEELEASAMQAFVIQRMIYTEVAATEVGEEVVAVSVCDGIVCGDCEGVEPSDGCQSIFALTNSAGSSPGLLPQVIISTDQFGTNAITERWITTFVIGENASDGSCVGPNYVAVSEDGEAIHYADASNMEDSAETWAKVTTGIVAGGGPNSMWNYSPLTTFLAGAGGYIYTMANPADGLTPVESASIHTDDYNDISGWNAEKVTAVGDAGAIAYTEDGATFSNMVAPTGTGAPTDLYAVAYRNEGEIWVAGDSGYLWYTIDNGAHWNSKAMSGSPTQMDKIVWVNETVGFAAGRTSGPASRVYRTINGGYTWYLVPEDTAGEFPASDYINDIAVCERESNRAFLGGLADNGADGILVKGYDQ